MVFTREMLDSMKKVEAAREANIAFEPRRMTADDKDALLRQYHPDYSDRGFGLIKTGPNKGEKAPVELLEMLEGMSRVQDMSLNLEAPDYDVDVHFIVGGTITNQTIIKACLKPFEAVISCDTGHIATHETGAIEATGHKVIPVNNYAGKINPSDIRKVFDTHMLSYEHMVYPKMVYISNATEYGTVYTFEELKEIRAVCDELGLYLMMDGARLGVALSTVDYTLNDLANLCDVFYIGGTKNGALLGEAIVFPNLALNDDFRYALKQRGALLAKGRVIASQFVALFEHDLYAELAQHANACAMRVRSVLSELGVVFYTDSPTNQQFPILPNAVVEALQQHYGFYIWKVLNERESVVRFVFSWATPMTMVDELLADTKRLLNP